MAKSILQNEKRCFLSGRTDGLHLHHVFNAANRDNSTKYGLVVYLHHELHNNAPDGYDVHHNRELSDMLKRIAQAKAMEHYGWTLEEWMRKFHKNYL
jgi:hypothetical protein